MTRTPKVSPKPQTQKAWCEIRGNNNFFHKWY